MATGAEFRPRHPAPKRVPKLREAQKALTRHRLIDAATREFVRSGYYSTTIDDIVVRAGATRATFYLHFSSKADVVTALYEEAAGDCVKMWEALREATAVGTTTSLRSWITLAFGHWERFGRVTSVMLQASSTEATVTEQREIQRDDALNAIMDGLSSRANSDVKSQRLRAVAAYAVLTGVFGEWLENEWTAGRQVMLDVIFNAWERLLMWAPAIEPGGPE